MCLPQKLFYFPLLIRSFSVDTKTAVNALLPQKENTSLYYYQLIMEVCVLSMFLLTDIKTLHQYTLK